MEERSYLSDMLPFHLEVFFVVRDVGSLRPAPLFFFSLTDKVLHLHCCCCCCGSRRCCYRPYCSVSEFIRSSVQVSSGPLSVFGQLIIKCSGIFLFIISQVPLTPIFWSFHVHHERVKFDVTFHDAPLGPLL